MATEKSKGSKTLSNTLMLVLLGLLLIGLGGYGITGFGTQVRSVGSVGGTEIDASGYFTAIRTRMAQISQQTGQEMTADQARELDLPQAVLQNQIAQAAIEEAARIAQISVGDAEVARRVQSVDAFNGLDGQFDRDTYRELLQRSGQTPGTFEARIRGEAAAQIVQRAVLNGITPPPTYARTLWTYAAETRDIAFAPLSASLLETPPAAPSEDEVKAWYDANPAAFAIPESRDLTYVWLAPAMLADQVELSDDDLRTAFEARADQYRRPERRMVDRLGFADMAAAEAAKAALDSGEKSFDDLLAERGLTEADVDLGAVIPGDLTGPAAAAVFGLADTGIAGPTESAVGPALFRVNAILAAQTTRYEDALPELRESLALERARDLVAERLQALDDDLAGGATLEDLAADTEMELGTVALTAGELPATPPASLPEFQNAAMAAQAGDFPQIEQAATGEVFALRLDTVHAASVRPLDEVRAEAEAGAAAQKEREALAALGQSLKDRLAAGEGYADLGLTPQTRAGLARRAPAFDLPGAVLDQVYDMAAGEVRVANDASGVYLVQVTGVTPPETDSAEAKDILAQLSRDTAMAVAQDILNEMARAVSETAGIELNQTAIDSVASQLR